MNCRYCGGKFAAEDRVIVLHQSKEIFHEGDCFTDYMMEKYSDQATTYIEYLENLIMGE